MRNEITLQELAISLNLSISTVSTSLNDSPEIIVKTKSRVKELAILKRYIPNSMAQSLKRKQSRTVGVIIPNIFSKFFPSLYTQLKIKPMNAVIEPSFVSQMIRLIKKQNV